MNKPIFFSTQALFRKWLADNHTNETELIVGYYKVKSGFPSMTWSESVDQALCYGWIDGVRNSIDEHSYQIRFTPRRKDSIWSLVNLDKIKKLKKEGLMRPAGIDIYNKRNKSKPNAYAQLKMEQKLPTEYIDLFKQNIKAWEYFDALAPSYKKLSIHWVTSAVQEKTRTKRLNKLIADCEAGTNSWKQSTRKK